MDGRPAGIRPLGGGPIERGLQPRRESAVGLGVRPRPARRRHRLRAQLLEDLLPDLGIGADVLDVDVVEGKVSGQQTLVVAGDAVTIQHRPPGRGVGRRGRLTRRPPARLHGCGRGRLGCRGHGAQDERNESATSQSGHGRRCRPGSPHPTRHRRLPHTLPSTLRPDLAAASRATRRLTAPLPAQPTLLSVPHLTGARRYRIGPSLKMSMKLSVVSALPSARSRSAVLPPPSPGSRMCPPPSAIISGVMPR